MVSDKVSWQVILQSEVRRGFVKKVHEAMTDGHLGRSKTEIQVSRRVYWPGWKSDVSAALVVLGGVKNSASFPNPDNRSIKVNRSI